MGASLQYGIVWLYSTVLQPLPNQHFHYSACTDISMALEYDLLNKCSMVIPHNVCCCPLALFIFSVLVATFTSVLFVLLQSMLNYEGTPNMVIFRVQDSLILRPNHPIVATWVGL